MRFAKCDECGQTADLARFNDAPHDWFHVHQEFDREHEDRYWHFCSQGCLGSFFALRQLPTPEPRDND
jgi:hypothetical protein